MKAILAALACAALALADVPNGPART